MEKNNTLVIWDSDIHWSSENNQILLWSSYESSEVDGLYSISEIVEKTLYLSPRNHQNELCKKLLKYDNVCFFRSVPASKTWF